MIDFIINAFGVVFGITFLVIILAGVIQTMKDGKF